MTLITYGHERLDQLALRVFDVAAQIRSMANRCRDDGIAALDLHDKKANEWLEKLEEWALKSSQEVDRVAARERGARRAKDFNATQADAKKGK